MDRLTGSGEHGRRRPGLLGQLGALVVGVVVASLALLLGAVLVAALLAAGLVVACGVVVRSWFREPRPPSATPERREMKTIHRVPRDGR